MSSRRFWHDFYNIVFKIKHKFYISSGSAPTPTPTPLPCQRKTLGTPIGWWSVFTLWPFLLHGTYPPHTLNRMLGGSHNKSFLFFGDEKIPATGFEPAVLPARSLVVSSTLFRVLHILHIHSLCLNQFELLMKLFWTHLPRAVTFLPPFF